jgi:hypothetical protein
MDITNDIDTGTDATQSLTEEEQELYGLGALIQEKFKKSEDARLFDEKRWLRAYRNYRGIYGPDLAFRENEKSKVFVKITKTKVLAAYGQIIEVLFSQGKFPIGIEPTIIPEGVSKYAHLKPDSQQQQQQPESPYGFPGDGKEIKPGTTINEILGGLKDEYGSLPFEDGPAPDLKSMPQIEPAKLAAENMEKVIHDQLDESLASNALRHIIFEMVLLGTGILKGPFNYEKKLHSWDRDEDTQELFYNPKTKLTPKVEAVSCWDFYQDPNATSIEDCNYIIQRHKLTASDMRDLLNRPFFRESAIRNCIEAGPNYEARSYETALHDRENQADYEQDRYEVFEYWGKMDATLAEEAGLDVDPDEVDVLNEVDINAWVCNGHVLRLVLNPFTPSRLPYMVCPYEINPYQFFGVGIPENMDDSQQIMNGHARMAIDNLALAGNLIFDVDETMLVPGQDMSVYPGKIFRRQSGQTGQAIHGLKFPNTANENLMMFDKFRQLADESTGIPSYSHGQTGIQSTTRTAAGMSMLLGAAALNIKTVIKNIDDYLLRPLGESLFSWNMQFNKDTDKIRGDLVIKARGTSSLMQKEVRSQRLMTFMQVASNPALAPFVKFHTILKEIAKSMDIDPEQVINDPEKAALYMKMMGGQDATQTTGNVGGVPGMGGAGGIPAGANPNDATGVGGGNIGVGSVPTAGEAQFSSPNISPEGTGEQ